MNKVVLAFLTVLLTSAAYANPRDCSQLGGKLSTDFTTDPSLKGKFNEQHCSYARGLQYIFDEDGNLSANVDMDCSVKDTFTDEIVIICKMKVDVTCSPKGNYAHKYEVTTKGVVRDSTVIPWDYCSGINISQKIEAIRKPLSERFSANQVAIPGLIERLRRLTGPWVPWDNNLGSDMIGSFAKIGADALNPLRKALPELPPKGQYVAMEAIRQIYVNGGRDPSTSPEVVTTIAPFLHSSDLLLQNKSRETIHQIGGPEATDYLKEEQRKQHWRDIYYPPAFRRWWSDFYGRYIFPKIIWLYNLFGEDALRSTRAE